MKVVVDIPEIPKNDKQRWVLANGTPYEERAHGEWIPTDDGDEIYGNYEKCTNCCESIISTHMSYCGNCGAKMGDKKDDLVEIIEAVQSMKEVKQNEQTTD